MHWLLLALALPMLLLALPVLLLALPVLLLALPVLCLALIRCVKKERLCKIDWFFG